MADKNTNVYPSRAENVEKSTFIFVRPGMTKGYIKQSTSCISHTADGDQTKTFVHETKPKKQTSIILF